MLGTDYASYKIHKSRILTEVHGNCEGATSDRRIDQRRMREYDALCHPGLPSRSAVSGRIMRSNRSPIKSTNALTFAGINRYDGYNA